MQVRIDKLVDYGANIVVLLRGKKVATFNVSASQSPHYKGDKIVGTMQLLSPVTHTMTQIAIN